MKITIKRIVLMAVVMVCGQCFAWTDLGGGDHGGSNWTIAAGSTIASNHYNLGTVMISSGATVYVKAWDGTKYGGVAIDAAAIQISGILDASGAGYSGGNGGSGGAGSTTLNASGGAGNNGVAGGGPYGGSAGGLGIGGYDSSGNPALTRQGAGGRAGNAGGYALTEAQGDTTTNEAVMMGSGGGGGGGGGAGWNYLGTTSGGGGGGGGNPGGGWVSLVASNTIVVRGSVMAKGRSGVTGTGGTGQTQLNPGAGGGGGSASGTGTSAGGNGGASIPSQCYPGGHGGSGGAGAGGGILLKADTVDTLGATLDNCGGGNSTTNGGTLKIFYITLQGGSYTNTGRAYLKQLMLPEPGTVFEF